MTIRLHQSCLFTSSPIADCGRDMVVPEPVLASHWPLSVIGIALIIFVGWTFLRSIYRQEIDWEQEPEKKPLRHPEDIARDAGLGGQP
jgi:hypothetical protein